MGLISKDNILLACFDYFLYFCAVESESKPVSERSKSSVLTGVGVVIDFLAESELESIKCDRFRLKF